MENAPVEKISQHANALGILLDLHPEDHDKIARDVLLKSARARRPKTATASPFFYAYVLEAMIRAGHSVDALTIIRDKWGAQLDRGATAFWEHWEPTGSLCHAWSASPLYLLYRVLLGVEPLTPGWKKIRIAPTPGELEFARGTIATPHGSVRIEWEQSGDDQLAVRVDLPDGMEAEFIAPLGGKRMLGAGGHEFHT